MVRIEFFHDVICSFCFPMSYRMRQVQEKAPEAEIIHRSFALIGQPSDFAAEFGSHEAAKGEIIKHWQQANRVDDLRRFNIEGMERADFLFPTSMPGLTACKAAEAVGGKEAYWDMFDAVQTAFFVNSKNIESVDVLADCARSLALDMDQWQEAFHSPKIRQAIKDDFALVAKYDINTVPSLVINGTYKLVGVQPLEIILETIEQAKITNG